MNEPKAPYNTWIKKLVDINTEIQSSTRATICSKNQDIWYYRNVKNPTDKNEWVRYFKTHKTELFSKGFDRYKLLLGFLSDKPKVILDTDDDIKSIIIDSFYRCIDYPTELKKTFILSCLLVILQPFGDGNHRTAEFYFKTIAQQKSLTKQSLIFPQDSLIDTRVDNLIIDHNTLTRNPIMLCRIFKELDELFALCETKYI